MKYKVLEGITTADVAYKVYGKTIEELFQNAAEAVEQVMVDLKTINPLNNQQLSISNQQLDNLLLDFLNELLFYKDSQGLVFCQFKISIRNKYELNAKLFGEKIDIKKHKLRCDVKAVTRHHLEIKKDDGKFIATIVLDI
ncbi:archease [Candidatus Gottesmanbacteria bacterium]|nr:archease [Candidatus Gottesmanbacteria bacterium]MBI5451918.1 archease [Candidatus Gottesmanbacteria bacterium]